MEGKGRGEKSGITTHWSFSLDGLAKDLIGLEFVGTADNAAIISYYLSAGTLCGSCEWDVNE